MLTYIQPMKYSNNPKDWYFDVLDEEGELTLALSQSPRMLDDSLGSHNLPEEIKKLLAPLGVYVEAELAESVWEVYTITIVELTSKMIELGFNKTDFLH